MYDQTSVLLPVRCTLQMQGSQLQLHANRQTRTIPSVPTNELVRKSAVHDRVSINGICRTESVNDDNTDHGLA